jgi:hypothetical protein
MNRFRHLGWVGMVAVACNAFAWTTLGGCSGDDNQGDAGDGSIDQTADTKANDVAVDNNVPDVGPDVSEGGPSDAGPDVTAIISFQQAYAQALCQRLSTCCYGAQLDASAPDAAIAACEANTESSTLGGIEYAIGEIGRSVTLHGGNIAVNETAATSCLAALQTLTCGQITGTEYTSMVKNCLGALSGTLSIGASGCTGSVECNNGYCQAPAADAGPDASGTCVALSTIGQDCNPVGGGNDDCMYRGWLGTQQARCDIVETTANTCASTGNPTFKCTAKTPDNGTCLYEWECANTTCGDSCECIPSSQTWTYPFFGVCPEYFGADSGLN